MNNVKSQYFWSKEQNKISNYFVQLFQIQFRYRIVSFVMNFMEMHVLQFINQIKNKLYCCCITNYYWVSSDQFAINNSVKNTIILIPRHPRTNQPRFLFEFRWVFKLHFVLAANFHTR